MPMTKSSDGGSSASLRLSRNSSSFSPLDLARRLVSSASNSVFSIGTMEGGDSLSLATRNTIDDGVMIRSPIT